VAKRESSFGFLRRAVARLACVLVLLAGFAASARSQPCPEPSNLRFEIAGKIVRSKIGFTQGLEFRDGKLYESTGAIGGTTQLNVIALDGRVTTLADHGTRVFGEGLTILNDEIVQLTWREHEVFVYDLAGKLLRRMRNPRDGWGLTNDGKSLIFTDGGPLLIYADPKTFAIGKAVTVRSNRATEVHALNELELVAGKIFANIFTTRTIVRVDPVSGCIDGTADLGLLWDAMTPRERLQASGPDNVLNGIAYDAKSGLFYLTGKRWLTIFTGRFVEAAR
jgi:glutaminyl-peptide cyclotransferase